MWELVTVAFESIRSNKLRSFLTTLGIVIGIAAVISVVAIGQGGRAMLMQEMESFGTNIFVIYADYKDGESYRTGDFQVSDIDVIKDSVPEVKYLAPVTYNRLNLRGSKGQVSAQVLGTTADYANIRNLALSHGRFLSEDDEAVGRKVMVIDVDTAKELFGTSDVIGERVVINGNSALVVGVLENNASMLDFGSDKTAYLPLTFLQNLMGWDGINQFAASAASREEVSEAMERSKTILERRHNAPEHYVSYSMEQDMQSANKITGIMSMIISCIAGISLLVGGIGVMNIMMVSVTERTREVGIRMALGARRRDILVQFLIEAIVLCLLGGLVGIIFGYGGAFVVAKIANWPPLVSWSTVLIAFVFSAAVGLFFGIYPANKAAKLNPIEALRRD